MNQKKKIIYTQNQLDEVQKMKKQKTTGIGQHIRHVLPNYNVMGDGMIMTYKPHTNAKINVFILLYHILIERCQPVVQSR